MNQTMSDDIPQDQVEAVAKVLCPSDMNYVCANQSGFPCSDCRREAISAIRAIAPFIAAVEREKLAAWMILNSIATGHGDTIEDLLLELDRHIDMMDADFAHAAAVERERCADYMLAFAANMESEHEWWRPSMDGEREKICTGMVSAACIGLRHCVAQSAPSKAL